MEHPIKRLLLLLISLGYKGMFTVADSLHSSNSLAVLAMFSNSSSTVSPSLIFAKRVKSGFIIFSCCTFFRLSSLFDDYPVLLTSSSEYREHLPILVNASWLFSIFRLPIIHSVCPPNSA